MKAGIKECAKALAADTGCSVSAAETTMRNVINAIQSTILSHGGVSFTGVFSLEVVERKEKQGFNPRTGEKIAIPAHKTLKLTVGKNLKEKLN